MNSPSLSEKVYILENINLAEFKDGKFYLPFIPGNYFLDIPHLQRCIGKIQDSSPIVQKELFSDDFQRIARLIIKCKQKGYYLEIQPNFNSIMVRTKKGKAIKHFHIWKNNEPTPAIKSSAFIPESENENTTYRKRVHRRIKKVKTNFDVFKYLIPKEFNQFDPPITINRKTFHRVLLHRESLPNGEFINLIIAYDKDNFPILAIDPNTSKIVQVFNYE